MMSNTVNVFPIVEGHGEVSAVPVLIRKLGEALFPDLYINVLQPFRQPKDRLKIESYLCNAVEFGISKLKKISNTHELQIILILVDADSDKGCELGPQMLNYAVKQRGDREIEFISIVAVVEYETWFVASAESLTKYINIEDDDIPDDPEKDRCSAGWIDCRFISNKYSKTVDQPKLTSALDIELCRKRSKSFDKLCRDFERLLG